MKKLNFQLLSVKMTYGLEVRPLRKSQSTQIDVKRFAIILTLKTERGSMSYIVGGGGRIVSSNE